VALQAEFRWEPDGPFDLLHQNKYFNGWPTLARDPATVVMAFPVEGWSGSAAVTLTQDRNGSVHLVVFGEADQDRARRQALAALSLDEDGSGWPAIGERDDVLSGLQATYRYMRPTLFHSPYEAAAAFVIGHRISIRQARRIRSTMAAETGVETAVGGESFYAFPDPQRLMSLVSFPGLSQAKVGQLHAVAQAALDGRLDRTYLRSLDEETALAGLQTLPGIGPFFSQGILYRGAGKRDGFTRDDMTRHAIRTAYELAEESTNEEVLAIADRWRPYRMWATVLLHVWVRETGNLPKRTFSRN
jgi:3-methyladenine DNA glycosylase/8-oxoguanine DNA glycosylase